MNVATVSRGNARGLPAGLATAQAAIQLPEVQDMLRRLAEFQLGIFMPHMHDESTGEFQRLDDDLIQMESGLEVSFRPTVDIEIEPDRFLPVGWCWRAGAAAAVAACEMARDEGLGDAEGFGKHTMIKGR